MDPLVVDNSTLAAVAKCSTLALGRYVLGYASTEERAELRAGTGLHEAMAAHFGGAPVDKALAEFAASYQTWAEATVPPDHRLAWPNVERITRYWLETHALGSLPFRVDPRLIEIPFSFPLTPEGECACGHPSSSHRGAACRSCPCPGFQPIVFAGRLDALGALDGAAYVVENKSTGRISEVWLKKWWLDSQLSGYTEAGRLHCAQPLVGVILNAVEFSRLPQSDRKCDRHGTRYAECGHLHAAAKMLIVGREQWLLTEWKKTALHLARRFRDLTLKWATLDAIPRVRMQGTFNGSCPWCAFADWCAAGRDPGALQANFTLEPWSPFTDRNTAKKP